MFFSCLMVFVVVLNVSSADKMIWSSCKQAFENACNKTSGEFRVKTQTDLGYSDVYCQMTTLDDCQGGGWTLALKIKAKTPTFVYNSSLWTNKESYNPMNGKMNDKETETKLPTYWSTPFSEICLVKAQSSVTSMVIPDYQALSLYHLIADGEKRPTNITIDCWQEWGGFFVSAENRACVEQGFNIGGNMTDDSKARLGILISNVANGCHQATHWTGVGIDDIDEDNMGVLLRVGAGYYGGSSYVPFDVHIYVR